MSDIGRTVTKVMGAPKLEDLELLLSETAQKIYNMGQKLITPARGWILIRTIADREELNGIVIPDKKQSQANSEGIVMAVWAAWEESRMENNTLIEIEHRSAMKIGERVLFNRWDGTPVPFLDEKKYRLIHEKEWQSNGGILGTIDYKADDELRISLNELLDHLQPVHESLFRGKSE